MCPVVAAGWKASACTWPWCNWPSSAGRLSGSKWITVAANAVVAMARQATSRHATDRAILLGRGALFARIIRGRLHPPGVTPVGACGECAQHDGPGDHHDPRPRRPGMAAEGDVTCLHQPVGGQKLGHIVQE